MKENIIKERRYTRDQLINALTHEYDYLIHDDFDPDEDLTLEEYVEYLKTLSTEELEKETDTDNEIYSLDEYMENHSRGTSSDVL